MAVTEGDSNKDDNKEATTVTTRRRSRHLSLCFSLSLSEKCLSNTKTPTTLNKDSTQKKGTQTNLPQLLLRFSRQSCEPQPHQAWGITPRSAFTVLPHRLPATTTKTIRLLKPDKQARRIISGSASPSGGGCLRRRSLAPCPSPPREPGSASSPPARLERHAGRRSTEGRAWPPGGSTWCPTL